MHSSRMRTSRLLTICCSPLPGVGGEGVSASRRVSAPRGDVCSGGGVSAPGGLSALGVVCSQGGVCSWGWVSAPRGGVCSGGCLLGGCLLPGGSAPRVGGCLLLGGVFQHALRHTPSPLWTEFLTHASENITLAQLRCGR